LAFTLLFGHHAGGRNGSVGNLGMLGQAWRGSQRSIAMHLQGGWSVCDAHAGAAAKPSLSPDYDDDPEVKYTRSGGACCTQCGDRIGWCREVWPEGARNSWGAWWWRLSEAKGLQQILPRVEDQIACDRRKIAKQKAAGTERLPGGSPVVLEPMLVVQE
jgi:hypothetical protein